MTALDKFREQVRIARETGTFVVQTADEAAAVLAQIEGPAVVTLDCSKIDVDELRNLFADAGRIVRGPPYDGDDEHA